MSATRAEIKNITPVDGGEYIADVVIAGEVFCRLRSRDPKEFKTDGRVFAEKLYRGKLLWGDEPPKEEPVIESPPTVDSEPEPEPVIEPIIEPEPVTELTPIEQAEPPPKRKRATKSAK